MKIKLHSAAFTLIDEDTKNVMVLMCGHETDYGWTTSGSSLPIFTRYLLLMAQITDFMRSEKDGTRVQPPHPKTLDGL